MRGRVFLLGLMALLSLSLFGCDPGFGSSSSEEMLNVPKVSEGWSRYGSAQDGFTLDVPATWQKLELSGDDLEMAIKALSSSNSALASFLDNETFRSQISMMADSGVMLMLYDSMQDIALTGFATNINVVRVDVPSGMTLDQVMERETQEIERALSSGLVAPLNVEDVTLSGTPAKKLTYSYGINMPDGSYIVGSMLQYGVLSGNTEYVLTFTTTPEEQRLRSITFEAIAKKWRVLK